MTFYSNSIIYNFQVYLPAIKGYVPNKMLRAVRYFLEFCYLARRDTITEETLKELENALQQFQLYRQIFQDEGVRAGGFSLP